MIDTAYVYGNMQTEGLVGEGIAKAITEDYYTSRPFITTKVWRKFHGYDATLECLNESLDRLGLEQIDLVLIHWPGPAYSTMNRRKDRMDSEGVQCYFMEGQEDIASLRLETWRALEDAYLSGKCRAIGVSNFTPVHLRKLLSWPELRVKPAVNQVEMHPYYIQKELRDYCAKEEVVIQAYSSLGGQDFGKKGYARLGRPRLLDNPVVYDIATKHNKTNAQILLRWGLQHGAAVLPKSENQDRIIENMNIFNFDLSVEDMDALDQLDCGKDGRLTWVRDPMRDLDFD